MLPHQTEHHKKFQIERIALFSDAVFAIAITLLIIEVKVPEAGHPATDAKIWEKLEELTPRLIGFVISFYVIGLYWLVHHRMFGYVIGYNRKLLINNLVFLFSIVLMPFSSAFYSEYFVTYTHIPLAFYVANISFSGLMSFRLWRLLALSGGKLSEGLQNRVLVRYFLIRSLTVPFIFILVLLVSLVFGQSANYVTLLLPLLTLGIVQYYRKKYPHLIPA